MNWNNKTSLSLLLAALVSAVLLLVYFSTKVSEKNFDDLALNDKTTTIFDMLNNKPINYLNFTIELNASHQLLKDNKEYIFSFGNSQSHSINSYTAKKDHLFIYYLDKNFEEYNMINLSAPNANLQEMFLGLVNTERLFTKKIKMVFFSIVFDDTREDGIRSNMHSLIQDNKNALTEYPSGRLMITSIEETSEISSEISSEMLLKFKTENTLNDLLDTHFETYHNRGKIRAQLETQLYFFRNWIFGIKPTTKRKKIDAIYSRNLTALKDIVKFCQKHNIKLFFYIAPLRNDIEIPYIVSEYDSFKSDISNIYRTYNLENIVSGNHWGKTHGDWVDFMHFKGEGHMILAKELEKILRKEGI